MNLSRKKEKLRITPRLLRIFNILQMSFVELAEFIQNQLMENPILDLKDDGGEPEYNKINIINLQQKKINVSFFEIPDIVILKKENNYYGYVTQGYLSSLALNDYYVRLIESASIEKETRRYLTEKIENASMILDAVSLRRKILLNLADLIIIKNKDFLENGWSSYRRTSLKEVSDLLKVNTIILSSVVYGKYLETPKGLYSLEKLFGKNLFV